MYVDGPLGEGHQNWNKVSIPFPLKLKIFCLSHGYVLTNRRLGPRPISLFVDINKNISSRQWITDNLMIDLNDKS